MTRALTAYERGKRAGLAEARQVTDDMVERARGAYAAHMCTITSDDGQKVFCAECDEQIDLIDQSGGLLVHAHRAALEAALNPKEAPGA